MNRRKVVGIIFVVAALLKLADMWNVIHLLVPTIVNVVVKSRSFIGGTGNETTDSVAKNVPYLHIIASNMFGGISIRN